MSSALVGIGVYLKDFWKLRLSVDKEEKIHLLKIKRTLGSLSWIEKAIRSDRRSYALQAEGIGANEAPRPTKDHFVYQTTDITRSVTTVQVYKYVTEYPNQKRQNVREKLPLEYLAHLDLREEFYKRYLELSDYNDLSGTDIMRILTKIFCKGVPEALKVVLAIYEVSESFAVELVSSAFDYTSNNHENARILLKLKEWNISVWKAYFRRVRDLEKHQRTDSDTLSGVYRWIYSNAPNLNFLLSQGHDVMAPLSVRVYYDDIKKISAQNYEHSLAVQVLNRCCAEEASELFDFVWDKVEGIENKLQVENLAQLKRLGEKDHLRSLDLNSLFRYWGLPSVEMIWVTLEYRPDPAFIQRILKEIYQRVNITYPFVEIIEKYGSLLTFQAWSTLVLWIVEQPWCIKHMGERVYPLLKLRDEPLGAWSQIKARIGKMSGDPSRVEADLIRRLLKGVKISQDEVYPFLKKYLSVRNFPRILLGILSSGAKGPRKTLEEGIAWGLKVALEYGDSEIANILVETHKASFDKVTPLVARQGRSRGVVIESHPNILLEIGGEDVWFW